jgi:hypothetical protein
MNASLIALAAVVLGVLLLVQGSLLSRTRNSPARADAARRAAEVGGLVAILSAPWVLIVAIFVD